MRTTNSTAQKPDKYKNSPVYGGAFFMVTYSELKSRLAASTFRSRFKLGEKERRYAAENSREVISSHARKIISSRLAPAFPVNDGKQTPMRGHAVFIAQHATGCCCRGCLAKWHNIPPGRELSETEISSIVNVIVSWILEQREKKPVPHTPDLF